MAAPPFIAYDHNVGLREMTLIFGMQFHVLTMSITVCEQRFSDGIGEVGQIKARSLLWIFFQGDSGGPLVVQNEDDGRYTQVGIVSFGLGACDVTKTSPVAFTRVSEFLQFVSLAINEV